MSQPSPPTNRIAGLEVGRVAAAIAIVWLHTAGIGPRVAPLGSAGRFAVPFFTLLAAALIADRCSRGGNAGLGEFARQRLVRLYVPFLFWCAVYLGLRLLKHALRPAGHAPPVGPHLLVVGSAHHLWYLPFLLLVSIAVRLVSPVAAYARLVAASTFIAGGLAMAFIPLRRPHNPPDAGFLNQLNYLVVLGWAALPAALWGTAVGLYFFRIESIARNRPLTSLAFAMLAGGLLFPGDDFPARVARENLSGVAVMAACWTLPVGSFASGISSWGRYAFGVYAVHVSIILALEAVFVSDRSGFSIWQAVAIFSGSVVGSVFVARTLTRSRFTAWTVS